MKTVKKTLLAALLLSLALCFGIKAMCTASPCAVAESGDGCPPPTGTALNTASRMENGEAAPVKPAPITVTYSAGLHGTLASGDSSQTTRFAAGAETAVTVPGVNAAAGYTFAGWHEVGCAAPLGSGDAGSAAICGGTTFVAQYTRDAYTVTFDLGKHGRSGGNLVFNDVHYGDTLVAPSVKANKGWRFAGWDKAPAATVTGSAVYTARYTRVRYSVTFRLAGLGTSPDTLTFSPVYYGNTISIPAVTPNPGWTFDGWDRTPAAKVTGSAAYTAQYTRIPYTVTFDLAGLGTSPDTLTFDPVYYGDAIAVPSVTPNPGWMFIGWDTPPSATVTGNAVYTAVYQLDRHK